MIASASRASDLAIGGAGARATGVQADACLRLLDRGVAIICLDRLLADNGPGGQRAFHALCDGLANAHDIAALVLKGSTAWRGGDDAGHERAAQRLTDLASILPALPYPIIASISGDTSMIGLRVACVCHFVIAEEEVAISAASEPHASTGTMTGRETERWKAARDLFADRSIAMTAAEAFAARLVDGVVSAGQGASSAVAIAKTLANGPGELIAIAQRQAEMRRTALAA
ncbi:hypothetical protein [Sphingopyxis granuli]|uniref:hypothetical protein n=1 Tax=Sphingopyxis granuli TaxID=267128 RepID=UPI00301C577D